MSIVKIPKKLKDICIKIRTENMDEGIEELHAFTKLEVQKKSILAELAVFSYNFEEVFLLEQDIFLCYDQWYSSNIFQEHLAAYTFATLEMNKQAETIIFYQNFLAEKLSDENLQPHQQNYFKIQIEKNISLLSEGFLILEKENRFSESNAPKQLDHFINLLKDKRPKLAVDSIEAADYMLNFIYSDGVAADFITMYSKYASNSNFNARHHLNAAKIYHASGDIDNARQCVFNYVKYAWEPVEFTQVMPLTIFLEYSLYNLYSKEFLMELMEIKKDYRYNI